MRYPLPATTSSFACCTLQGFLGGDHFFFFLDGDGLGCGVVGVAVGGAPLLGRHVPEAVQGDRVAVAVAGLELGQVGDRVVVGRFGFDRGRAGSIGTLARGFGRGVALCQISDGGVVGAVLGERDAA